MTIHSINEGMPRFQDFSKMLCAEGAIGKAEVSQYADVMSLLRQDPFLLQTLIKDPNISQNKKFYIISILISNSRDYTLSLIGFTLFLLSDSNQATKGEGYFYTRRLSDYAQYDTINARMDILSQYGLDSHIALLESKFPVQNKGKASRTTKYTLYRSEGILEGSLTPLLHAWNIMDNGLLRDFSKRVDIVTHMIYIIRSKNIDTQTLRLPSKLKSIIDLILKNLSPYEDSEDDIHLLCLKTMVSLADMPGRKPVDERKLAA